MSSDESPKPDAAAFANTRHESMMRSQKAANSNFRMMPASSKIVDETQKTLEEQQPKTDDTKEEPAPPAIDFTRTSQAVLDACRKIRGRVLLSAKEKREICSIMQPRGPNSLLMLVLGIVLGIVFSNFRASR